MPAAGDALHGVENERDAKQIVEHRDRPGAQGPERDEAEAHASRSSSAAAPSDGPKELAHRASRPTRDGSAEALRDALLSSSPSDKVKVNVIHAAVGAVTRERRACSPTRAARSSSASTCGPTPPARQVPPKQLGVDVRIYQIIYELVDDVRAAMAGLLAPTVKEAFLGRAEVRKTFNVPRIGTVAGCYSRRRAAAPQRQGAPACATACRSGRAASRR